MTQILFVSNNKSHWPLSVSATVAGTYDSTRVPYALSLLENNTIASPVFAPSSSTVTWIHFRSWSNQNNTTEASLLLRVLDAAGNPMCDVIGEAVVGVGWTNRLDLVARDSAGSVIDVGTHIINVSTVNTIDVRVEVDPTFINCKLYINGGLAATSNQPSNAGAWTNPTQINVRGLFASPSAPQYFSEFIISDKDTRNARMSLLRPLALGGLTDWVGDVTQLADDDSTSGITTTIAEQRESVTITAYTGATNISSMVIATQAVAGSGAPQNMKHLIRKSAVNYEGATTHLLQEVLEYDITDFQTNPATSAPWSSADLTGLEIGFISKP
jgi:hypothetical protein